MADHVESLVLQLVERLSTLDDKWDARWGSVQSELSANRVELARMATTVELHEKRSTTLEAMHNDCKRACAGNIDAVTASTQKALHQVGQIRMGFRWAATIAASTLTVVGVLVAVLDFLRR